VKFIGDEYCGLLFPTRWSPCRSHS